MRALMRNDIVEIITYTLYYTILKYRAKYKYMRLIFCHHRFFARWTNGPAHTHKVPCTFAHATHGAVRQVENSILCVCGFGGNVYVFPVVALRSAEKMHRGILKSCINILCVSATGYLESVSQPHHLHPTVRSVNLVPKWIARVLWVKY